MEKNCTNCKFNLPVGGTSYSGFCTNDFQRGEITSEHMVCSKYEASELPEKDLKNTIDNMQETIEALKCCIGNGESCETCPFVNFVGTCRHDLMFSALQLLSKQKSYIEALERLVGGYATDQAIWLTRNDGLEKENAELRAKVTVMNNEEILKEAFAYFADMYGFTLERNNYDGEIEYSCNGYVIDEDTAKVLVQAKRLIDWWE